MADSPDTTAASISSPLWVRLVGFDRSAIMTRAWELARAWHADARSCHFGQQQTRPRVALRLEAPASFTGRLKDHFAEALRMAWAEARNAEAAPERSEVVAARRDLIAAQMIDSTRIALPAIAAAEARLAVLQNSALRI
jgi:hypothetical protein